MATTKIRLDGVDERTDDMDEQVLHCRGLNHIWIDVPATPHRAAQMSRDGYLEIVRRCREDLGGCGGVWTVVINRRTGAYVTNKRDMPKDFAVPRGSGRMSKDAARAAWAARRDPQYYAKRSR